MSRPDPRTGIQAQLANILQAQAAIDRQLEAHRAQVQRMLVTERGHEAVVRSCVALCMRLDANREAIDRLAAACNRV